jgi:hypothetical protein
MNVSHRVSSRGNPTWRTLRLATAWLLFAQAILAATPTTAPIDWETAKNLYQRSQRGDALSVDEQAYLDRAKTERRRLQRATTGSAITARPFSGLVPLTQMKAGDKYKEFEGGLYGSGSNEPPAAHRRLANAAAEKIVLLDGEGKPSAKGRIVLMSIGMSNTTQEFSRFVQSATADREKSGTVQIVDAAQGGKDAAAWTKDAGPAGQGNPVWVEADRRLNAAGVTPQQVQVVWIKQALAGAGRFGEFPAHARALQDHLKEILVLAKARYPNLRIAYLSSRIYGGYAHTQLNPEPYAYEGAFAVQWTIRDQISGDPKLNADPAKGDVLAPVALWGPYLWADGVHGRKSDALEWKPEDLAGDGTHPSNSGREKVAQQLLQFFKTDPWSRPWFVAK